MVSKTLATLEGIGRLIDPNYNVMSSSSQYVGELVKNKYNLNNLSKELVYFANSFQRFFKKFPRQSLEVLQQIEQGDLTIKQVDLSFENKKALYSKISKDFQLLIISFSFLATALWTHQSSNDFSFWIQITFWSLAGVFFFIYLTRLIKTN